MNTYNVLNFEIVTNDYNVVTFARDLISGKFIKHDFARHLIKQATNVIDRSESYDVPSRLTYNEDDHIALDIMFYVITLAVCFTMVMFFAHLSVIENSIILMLLVVLKMMNVASVKVSHLSNKRWSI